MEQSEKIHRVIILILRASMLFAIGAEIIAQRWTLLFTTVLIFLLSFLPLLLERRMKIRLPVELELMIVLFIFASLYLGTYHDYYTKFPWWDMMLHAASGMGFGFAGFIILFVLYRKGCIYTDPRWLAFFTFCFGLAMGTLWEISEFAFDSIFGWTWQYSLEDTMWDLIVDALGSAFIAIIGYNYLQGKRTPVFRRVLKKFLERNS